MAAERGDVFNAVCDHCRTSQKLSYCVSAKVKSVMKLAAILKRSFLQILEGEHHLSEQPSVSKVSMDT